jgi:hypothetical protein
MPDPVLGVGVKASDAAAAAAAASRQVEGVLHTAGAGGRMPYFQVASLMLAALVWQLP